MRRNPALHRLATAIGTCLMLGGCGSKPLPSAPQAMTPVTKAPAPAPKIEPAAKPETVEVPKLVPKTTTPTKTPEVEWLPITSVVRAGAVEVSVESVRVGKVSYKSSFGRDATLETDKEYFILRLKVKNMTTTKRVLFASWHGDRANARDEHDNSYREEFDDSIRKIIGDDAYETIEPEGEVHGVIAFEKPIAAANLINVELDGRSVRDSGTTIRWKVSREQWETK